MTAKDGCSNMCILAILLFLVHISFTHHITYHSSSGDIESVEQLADKRMLVEKIIDRLMHHVRVVCGIPV